MANRFKIALKMIKKLLRLAIRSNQKAVICLLVLGGMLISADYASGSTLWDDSYVPATIEDPDATAQAQGIELGVKFQSNVDGFITGLRFYKGPGNTGTHLGKLWTVGGTLLAGVTFTNETASGWQEMALPAPVAITGGTTYVASYHTDVGRYSSSPAYFAGSGFDNPPLRALADGENGGNGVYRYGASAFPNQTYNSENYWVDVVFATSVGPDTTPPTVDTTSPVNGAVNVSTATLVAVTFSEAMDAATVDESSFELQDSASAVVAAAVTYNVSTRTATLAPGAPLAADAAYTAVVRGGSGGVADVAGNPLDVDYTWSFTTAAEGSLVYSSIWDDSHIPATIEDPDATAQAQGIELGVKFQSNVDGFITGLRFYKGPGNTGAHVGSLWTVTGTLLAAVVFTNETASGWQEMALPAPVAITGGTTYVASYHTDVGRYSASSVYFAGSGYDNPPLRALADGENGGNGVYRYGASAFPNQTYNSENYWVDVVFTTSLGPDTTPPTVDTTSPADGAVNVSTATAVSVTFSEAMDIATIDSGSFELRDASNVLMTAAVSYNSGTNTATLTPSVALSASTTYSATVIGGAGGVSDIAGNPLQSDYSWSFTTAASGGDTTPPTVTAFIIPSTTTTLTVTIASFTATDNVAVTGYMVTESPTAPSSTAGGWLATAPTSYTFATEGSKTLYAWAKDAAGNVSSSRSASVVITLQPGGPEPAGWYAGDLHVHRSCGGPAIDMSTMYDHMAAENLAVMVLLADLGNGEVQDPVQDLPRVTGQDDPVSTPGRIVHWDAEWHWDPIYFQFPHQALGGHVVALGLSEAYQIWEEYTFPIFEWAHQQNAIAGFAHMQYLDNQIPQSLSCCIPIEYPVEVALGSVDFISEDVDGSDAFIEAYYRLLNTGFRPGFAAGSDFPCNAEVGNLLTYVQVAGGVLTYRNWIEGIAQGRTVVSRNGHNEFLNLTVNNSATPGDEIQLTGGGSVQITIEWTANQNLTGTIELVYNGAVVASDQTSAAPGAPASLSTTAVFTNSGWLAARRMGSSGHQLHTAAVFVTVDNAPVRASETDALFYVQWMDNLLEKTSPGGDWNSYFVNNLDEAQARYQQARAIFQQIALEAGTDQSPPTVDVVSPPGGATGVGTGVTLTATFSEPMDSSTINTGTLALLDSSSSAVAGTVVYDSSTNKAFFTPDAPLEYLATYTALITGGLGGVTDVAGNPMAVDYSWSFTTAAEGSTIYSSIWNDSYVPATIEDPDATAQAQGIELGVKFQSNVDGFITGLRFYKGPGNTGTHVGKLWTMTGTLLAAVTFTNETASGWQEMALPAPLAITAGTTYVASYHTDVGRYSANSVYFAGSGFDNPPLRALADGESGGNGVYRYGASGFPNQTYNSENYWVDVVFTTSVGPDTTPPTVDTTSPADGAVNVSTDALVAVTFSEAMDAATINESSFELRDSASAAVPAAVTYNVSSRTATLAPGAPLATDAAYTAVVRGGSGGVSDVAGNSLIVDYTWSFTTSAGGTPISYSIWDDSYVPATIEDPDATAQVQGIELGVKFQSNVDGFITGLRFYKGSGNTGTHVGKLWTMTGTLLAAVTFTNETASGWQEMALPVPVAITGGTTYVASYHTDVGRYSASSVYFAGSGFDNPPLRALADGENGGNGVYRYGASAFPNQTYNSENYWVDVVFAANP